MALCIKTRTLFEKADANESLSIIGFNATLNPAKFPYEFVYLESFVDNETFSVTIYVYDMVLLNFIVFVKSTANAIFTKCGFNDCIARNNFIAPSTSR